MTASPPRTFCAISSFETARRTRKSLESPFCSMHPRSTGRVNRFPRCFRRTKKGRSSPIFFYSPVEFALSKEKSCPSCWFRVARFTFSALSFSFRIPTLKLATLFCFQVPQIPFRTSNSAFRISRSLVSPSFFCYKNLVRKAACPEIFFLLLFQTAGRTYR
jgi:hypothetical protein